MDVIIGPGYQSKVLAWIFDHFEQINAMPEHRKTVVDNAVAYLKKGESVFTAPEGDLHDTFQPGRFYPGVARIYRRTSALLHRGPTAGRIGRPGNLQTQTAVAGAEKDS